MRLDTRLKKLEKTTQVMPKIEFAFKEPNQSIEDAIKLGMLKHPTAEEFIIISLVSPEN